MPPLDYYTVALTVWLSPLSNRMLRYIGCGVARRMSFSTVVAAQWRRRPRRNPLEAGHFMPLGLNVFRKSFFAAKQRVPTLCRLWDFMLPAICVSETVVIYTQLA